MREAPRRVVRINGQHTLVVNYRGGAKRFVDAPPYHEELSGLHWYYCGFVPGLKAHLIGMSKDALFSGKLLFDESGRLMDAGHSVYPSPHGTQFLAIEQEDGMDGELWAVYNAAGKKLWSGYAGTLRMEKLNAGPGSKPYEAVESTYESPHWTAQDQLQATQVCGSGLNKGTINLEAKGGRWQWGRSLQCVH
ncbi:hypothetical protein ACXU4B_10910 [Dyella soli]|nr:hypothetical protein [Dyella soli]